MDPRAVDPEDGADWLDELLGRFDPGWLLDRAVAALPPSSRSGIRRIGVDDLAGRLARLCDLYERERDKLVAVARRRLGTHAGHAEDVVQEVMRKLCQHPPTLREPEKLTAYVYTALYNETSTWGGRAAAEHGRRAPVDVPAADVADPASGFDDVVVFHMVLARALAALSPQERNLVELVDIGRLTEREAAEKLGIALGTAKSYHHGARRRLRDDPGLAQLRSAVA